MQRVAYESASLARITQADASSDALALNESVTIGKSATVAGADRAPAMTTTASADRVTTDTTIAITKDRKFGFNLTGDDWARIRQSPDYVPTSIDQALRTWRNELHADLTALAVGAAGYYAAGFSSSGSAFGSAAANPFASSNPGPAMKKLLTDSLAPLSDRFLMIGTSEEQKAGELGLLSKANESGSDQLLRAGIIGRLSGFDVMVDNAVPLRTTADTGAAYVANGVNAAGSTALVLKTGTGTILEGSTISVVSGGITTLYNIATGGGIAAPGTVTLTSGLIQATTDGDVVTVIATHRRNIAFHREAFGLLLRTPKIPPGGDAGEHAVITDPVTGHSLLLSTYKGDGMNEYRLGSAWGVKLLRPELLKLLIGLP